MTKLLIPLATGLLLAACGGDGDTPAVATDVPATAAQSSDSYVAYTLALAKSAGDETSEALGLAAVDPPPTSETDEPVDFD